MPRGDDAVGLFDRLFPFWGLASIPLSERSASRLVLLRCTCVLVTKKAEATGSGDSQGVRWIPRQRYN